MMSTTTTAAVTKNKTRGMTLTALFAALIILMAFTPFLGYIPLGFTRATTIHIPVILGALLLGPKKGAILGFVFGLTSFINNTFVSPTLTSFVFTPFYSLGEYSGGVGSLIICFVPRILIGIVPYYVYQGICKLTKKGNGSSSIALACAGVSGALTNTLLVMNLIFLFFGKSYLAANSASVKGYAFILSIIGTNGVPEAIVAGILTCLVGKVLLNQKVKAAMGL